MISSWTLKTFKSVYKRTELTFAPLTLFAGVNSSGKSTILQSVLLIAQSLQSPVRSRAITLNGRVLRLGTYDDILSTDGSSPTIEIAFRLTALDPIRVSPRNGQMPPRLPYWRNAAEDVEAVNCSLVFSANEANERKEIVQLYPTLDTCVLEAEFREESDDLNCIRSSSIQMHKNPTGAETSAKQLYLSRMGVDELASLEFIPTVRAGLETLSEQNLQTRIVGVSRFHFLPRALLVRYDEVAEQARSIVQAFTNSADAVARKRVPDSVLSELPDEFKAIVLTCSQQVIDTIGLPDDFQRKTLFSNYDQLREEVSPQNVQRLATWLPLSQRTLLFQLLSEHSSKLEALARRGRNSLYRTRYQQLPRRLDFASDYISNYFTLNVKYLAPLRDEPKPVYPLSGASDPDDIGFHGEHTAAVLELNRTREVDYVPSRNVEQSVSGEPQRTSLEIAVLDWLVYMGVVSRVSTHDLGKLGHELKVAISANSELRDLTHVGVGVSQVLPIIVLCLLAEPGSTLIFEQPELHLHPRVQSRLADFFLSMTAIGKQCIVETHSEHLINKLRLRAAQAEGDDVAKLLAMYFVESAGEHSTYSPVQINSYGVIKNWPKGFFDEGENLASAIIKASIEKRAREKGRRDVGRS